MSTKLTEEEKNLLLAQVGVLRNPAGCQHLALRLTGKIWNAPGTKLDGRASTVCVSCETSKAVNIKPFTFPILKPEGE